MKRNLVSKEISKKNILSNSIEVTYLTIKQKTIWSKKATFYIWWFSQVALIRLLFVNNNNGRKCKNIEKNKKITLITFTVYPDLVRIWYFFIRRSIDRNMFDVVIVDCCGEINKKYFPEAQVIPFYNFSHSKKIDFFIKYVLKTPFVWICDDDIFILNKRFYEKSLKDLLRSPKTAVISFMPRGWYLFVAGKRYRAMGSYSILFKKDIFMKEKLSFSPIKSNIQTIGRIKGYYDTADYANEVLLKYGYKIKIINPILKNITGFVGTSVSMINARSEKNPIKRLEKQIFKTPNIAVYHIVGIYCNILIQKIYRKVFKINPIWQLNVSEKMLMELINILPNKEKTKTMKLTKRYFYRYKKIVAEIEGIENEKS